MSDRKIKIILIILFVLSSGLAAYFGIQSDPNIIRVTEYKYDTVYVENSIVICDTLHIPFVKTDTLNDTTLLSDTILIIDTLWLKETKPTWGSIAFGDSSNVFTNVSVLVDFPYGKREIVYDNKYKINNFRKYIGLGVMNEKLVISAGFFYHNFGLWAAVGKEQEAIGVYWKTR